MNQSHSYGSVTKTIPPSQSRSPIPALSPATNLSIASDRVDVTRSRPAKTKSFQISRSSSPSDHAPTLPDRSPEAQGGQPVRRTHSLFRAAESGKEELLPTTIKPIRTRTMSSSWTPPMRRVATQTEIKNDMSQSLRSRRRSSALLLEEEITDKKVTRQLEGDFLGVEKETNRYVRPTKSGFSDDESHTKTERPYRHTFTMNKAAVSERFSQITFGFIALLAVYLVLDSYYRALDTTDQLQHFKHQESMLMLHLHRVEQQSQFLHESLGRLNAKGTIPQGNSGSESATGNVDADLIWKQIQQLRQMEDEISHDVRSLELKIQKGARSSIVNSFGEGPVQVQLDLDLGEQIEGGNQIAILLWYDTPHAAWTLLEQIRKGVWTGAKFELDKGRSLMALPLNAEKMSGIDFVENSQKTHEAWTVGMTELVGGGLSLFINLQDNTEYHKHDVCVGKVVDGFGALQRLVEIAREGSDQGKAVTVREASASHLARYETAGIL